MTLIMVLIWTGASHWALSEEQSFAETFAGLRSLDLRTDGALAMAIYHGKGSEAGQEIVVLSRDGTVLWRRALDTWTVLELHFGATGDVHVGGSDGRIGRKSPPRAARLSAAGELVWDRLGKGQGSYFGIDASHGRTVAVGYVLDGDGFSDGVAVGLGDDGEVLWSDRIEGKKHQSFSISQINQDGTILAAGYAYVNEETEEDPLLAVYSADGDRLTVHKFPEPANWTTGLALTSFGYVLSAQVPSRTAPEGKPFAWLAAFDSSGQEMWRYNSVKANHLELRLPRAMADDRIVAIESSGPSSSNASTSLLVIQDGMLRDVIEIDIHRKRRIRDLEVLADGTVLLAGTEETADGQKKLWMSKISVD